MQIPTRKYRSANGKLVTGRHECSKCGKTDFSVQAPTHNEQDLYNRREMYIYTCAKCNHPWHSLKSPEEYAN